MSRNRKKFGTCPNCGQMLKVDDNYCPRCGQENHDLNVPFKHLVGELAENTLHLDTASYRTVRALLLKPGFLTTQFVLGKRKTFVAPVRLYILVSVLFFFLAALKTSTHSSSGGTNLNLKYYSISSSELAGLGQRELDSLMMVRGIERTGFNTYVVRQMARISSGGMREFGHILLRNISYMMFVLMPFFGFLLYMFYRRRPARYVECLIHSIHLHSFYFLLFSLAIAIDWIYSSDAILIATFLIVVVYCLVSLKTVYRQGWALTGVKTAVLGALYVISIGVLFLATVFLSIVIF